MLLATARRRPTHSMRLGTTTRPPRVWTALPLEHQLHVAHVVAVLVRRIRQQPQPDSCSESLEILT
jgi:hypothetical protein